MGIKDILLNPPLKDFRRGKILALSFGARGVSWGEGGVAGECAGQSEEWNWQEAHTLLQPSSLISLFILSHFPQKNFHTIGLK